MAQKLKTSFFQRETTKVALDLLGCVLNRVTKEGVCLKGRITETEAYLGLKDDCCHSFGGRKTKRTQVMYQPGGLAYVYFTYGMYYCFNIVTAGLNDPSAVLIRSIEPLEGLDIMQKNRQQKARTLQKAKNSALPIKKSQILKLTNGPGKLCQALHIDTSLNGALLSGDTLFVEEGKTQQNILTGPRVGLSPKRSACYWPLRFCIQHTP